jgi:hypothetical protein
MWEVKTVIRSIGTSDTVVCPASRS